MIEHLANNRRESELRDLIKTLENDELIKSLQSTPDFVDEIQGLEPLYQQFNEKVSFYPFYESYLNRIEEFAKKENSSENKKVLYYLYAAGLSKLYAIRKSGEKTCEENSLFLLSKPTSQISSDALLKHIIDHSMKFEVEYLGAKTFINDRIKPKLQQFSKEIDENIGILAMNLVSNDSASTLNKKKKLKSALNWRTIFANVELSAEIATDSSNYAVDITSIHFNVSKAFELQHDSKASESLMEIEHRSSNELTDIKSKWFLGQLKDAKEQLREIRNTEFQSFDNQSFNFQETIEELEQGISVLIDISGRIDSYLLDHRKTESSSFPH